MAICSYRLTSAGWVPMWSLSNKSGSSLWRSLDNASMFVFPCKPSTLQLLMNELVGALLSLLALTVHSLRETKCSPILLQDYIWEVGWCCTWQPEGSVCPASWWDGAQHTLLCLQHRGLNRYSRASEIEARCSGIRYAGLQNWCELRYTDGIMLLCTRHLCC